ncbi:four-carbon acid sugar kinase family protein [Ensifer sp. ENS11]|uniref:four-carbon acid sugar kinase family protein n=1 Tax=Ensifer sp. ENS11 TaxID=2769291 RepID=UPI00178535F0|nr:four-carbon acid sugar kinase family protein [Ensifer sp. ENS11]MBD9487899.1 four-carbon acid sugar kinase family protein [Ensifer sp. ENS11]
MLAIVADDLTGALDAAAPFASRGLHTEIALTVEAIPGALSEHPQVISVNIGSREMDVVSAQQATAATLAALPPGSRLFKKIDSRLKGHIAAELDIIPFRSALVAPAIPDFGRMVRAGHVQGFGVDTPISIAEKLGRHAGNMTIPDIATAEEMSRSLQSAQESGVDLLIGARGLAEALARQMTGDAKALAAEIPEGPGLFVIGSRDPITLAQIEELRATLESRYLPAPNGRLSDTSSDGSLITLVQAVDGDVAITSQEVSRLLAESVFPALTQAASTLLLSGGATAQAVLDKMGIKRFRLMGECMPGLGLAFANGHCIIAKSGGFGQAGTLREIAGRMLRDMG